jgi:hypothetical protein
MQMIGYKVLLKNIHPYAPLKLQVIIKMSYCFGYWISLIYVYIATTFVWYFVQAKKNQNWWFFDFEIYSKT